MPNRSHGAARKNSARKSSNNSSSDHSGAKRAGSAHSGPGRSGGSSSSGNSAQGSASSNHRKPGKPARASHGGRPGRNTNPRGQGGGGGRSGGKGRKTDSINPAKFLNQAAPQVEREVYESNHSFADFDFSDRLQRNIAAHGYVTPTQIQDVAIKPIMERKDLIGLANTGTGKTAAFVLPIIERLLKTEGKNDVLIITPTRELAAQIDDEFKAFAKGLKLFSCLCVGGTNINPQIKALSKEPHVVIGTPGRLKDLLQQRKLNLDFTDTLVLDEADRMLDMGFIKDVRFLTDAVPRERQSLCFSATITPDIERLINDLLNDPVKCSVRTSETNDHIQQDVVEASGKEDKIEVLHEILIKPEVEKVIVFGSTKWGVQKLADNLTKRGLPAEAIHGNKSQAQRQRSLKAFKQDKVAILVATDVASRGLDIPEVTHVINFDQPQTYEDYIHRIGRTGRAGLGGNAITFVPRG
jgi:superfamily II DNA/RNA helicase